MKWWKDLINDRLLHLTVNLMCAWLATPSVLYHILCTIKVSGYENMTPHLSMCDFCVARIWTRKRWKETQRKTPNKKLTTADIIAATFIVLIVPFFLSFSLSSIDSLQLLCYLVVSFIRNLAILIAFFISSHNVQRDEHVNDDTVPYTHRTRILHACVLSWPMYGIYYTQWIAEWWTAHKHTQAVATAKSQPQTPSTFKCTTNLMLVAFAPILQPWWWTSYHSNRHGHGHTHIHHTI